MSLTRCSLYYFFCTHILISGCTSAVQLTPPDWHIQPIPTGVSVSSEVLFEFNEAYKISNSSVQNLQLLGEKFEKDRMNLITLVGHAGPHEYSPHWLGLERAEFAKKQLIRSGVEPNRIYTETLGANKLRSSDTMTSSMQSVGVTMIGRR
jgi:outer membrane protein OmpA-like peptidoglycan-associated protein